MNNLIDDISEMINDPFASFQYQKISLCLFYHISHLEKLSAKEVLKKTGLSQSALKNYCQVLGFESFQHLKRKLESQKTLKEWLLQKKMNDYCLKDTESYFKKVLGLSHAEWNEFLSQIQKITNLLLNNPGIFVKASHFPRSLTKNFQVEALLHGIPTIPWSLYSALLPDFERKGCLFYVSLSGLNLDVDTHFQNNFSLENCPKILIGQKKDKKNTENFFDVHLVLPAKCSYPQLCAVFLMSLDLISAEIYKKKEEI